MPKIDNRHFVYLINSKEIKDGHYLYDNNDLRIARKQALRKYGQLLIESSLQYTFYLCRLDSDGGSLATVYPIYGPGVNTSDNGRELEANVLKLNDDSIALTKLKDGIAEGTKEGINYMIETMDL